MTAPASTLPPGLLASWLPRAVDAHAIVAVTDAAGVIRYANDAFTALSGYSREELIGKTHALIKSGEHPPEFYAQLWQTIRRSLMWRSRRTKWLRICSALRTAFASGWPKPA